MKRKHYALLARHNNFARADATDIAFAYDFEGPWLARLEAKWGLREIAGEGDTQSRALNLLHWLCAHTRHGNPNPKSLPDGLQLHADSLLDWCFDQPGNDPNCKHLSIILSECLLAVGIKAYALWCFPKADKGDNHVVVQVWLPEESRWIMLDPSWAVYFTDEAGRILCARQVREYLGSGAFLQLNPEGQRVAGWYIDYMAADMYHFNRVLDTRYGVMRENSKRAQLCPVGYDPAKKRNPNDYATVYATFDSFWK